MQKKVAHSQGGVFPERDDRLAVSLQLVAPSGPKESKCFRNPQIFWQRPSPLFRSACGSISLKRSLVDLATGRFPTLFMNIRLSCSITQKRSASILLCSGFFPLSARFREQRRVFLNKAGFLLTPLTPIQETVQRRAGNALCLAPSSLCRVIHETVQKRHFLVADFCLFFFKHCEES